MDMNAYNNSQNHNNFNNIENITEKQNLKEIIEVARQLTSGLEIDNVVKIVSYVIKSKFNPDMHGFILPNDIDDLKPIYFFYNNNAVEKIELNFTSLLSLKNFFETQEFNQISFEHFNEIFKDELIIKELINYIPEFIIPLKSYKGFIGIYIQSKKKDNTVYSMDDIQYCIDILSFASISLENANLYREAIIDRMTKLFTHHQFQERLTRQIKLCHRYGNTFSLIMFDIDHFKHFNDNYGHLIGDLIIKEISKIVLKSIRDLDFPARYGGEEFMILLPETELASASALAERLRKQVEDYLFQDDNNTYHVEISVGVIEFNAKYVQYNEDIIEVLDKSLYVSKMNGRNRVTIGTYDEK